MAEGTKPCMFCAEEIKVDAKICRFCNREQVDPAAKSAEDIFYDGAVLHRTFIGEHVMYGFIALAGVVLAIYLLASGSTVWWLAAVPVLLGVGGSLVRVIKTSSLRWKITSQRIQTERGIFSKKIDVVELWRVEDITYSQSLWQRVLNEATIKLITMDKTTPELSITGLTNHRNLYEKLRTAVEKRRKDARVLAVESHS